MSNKPATYTHPEKDDLRICQACYRRLRRQERGLQKPGRKPLPIEQLSEKTLRNKGLLPPKTNRRRAQREPAGQRGPRRKYSSTHCAQGHEYAVVGYYKRINSAYVEGFQRVCRACARNYQQKYRGRELTPAGIPIALANGKKTHCPQGHEYCEANSYYLKSGARKCKICVRNTFVLKTYGLTPEDFDSLLAQQGNACAICLELFTEPGSIHTDHDHLTGLARGLLCTSCNNGLGRFKDSISALRRAADYLDRAPALTGERH